MGRDRKAGQVSAAILAGWSDIRRITPYDMYWHDDSFTLNAPKIRVKISTLHWKAEVSKTGADAMYVFACIFPLARHV